jgi:integrase
MENQTVASMFETYLSRADLRPASVRFKKMALEYFLSAFGDMAVGGVTPALAEDYRTLLAKGRSKRSANGYLANFKPFWAWLFRHRIIEQNPFDSVILYRIAESRRETFGRDELAAMVYVADPLWQVRICLGLLGCRRGEMLNVCTRDIDLSANHPHILLCDKKQTEYTWPWQPKNYRQRLIALPERMTFGDRIVDLHRRVLELIEFCDPKPYLCIEDKYYQRNMQKQREGKLTDLDAADPCGNFQRMFRDLQKRAGLRTLRRYHELRAAFVTRMIAAKGLSKACEAAGHSNVQQTRTYDRFSAMQLVADMSVVASNY